MSNVTATLLVGGFGFFGVILTLFANAWLDRRAHDRKIRHQQKTLRIALFQELKMLKSALQGRLDTMEEAAKPDDTSSRILVPVDKMNEVYQRHLGQIGMLTEVQVENVLAAYVWLGQLPSKIELLSKRHPPGPQDGPNPNYYSVHSKFGEALKGLHEIGLDHIDAALAALRNSG